MSGSLPAAGGHFRGGNGFLLVAVLGILLLAALPPSASALAVPSNPAVGLARGETSASGSGAAGTGVSTPDFPTSVRHVILIIEENKEWSAVWKYGPYEVSLARSYANVSQYYGLEQASYPTYAAATSGYYAKGAPRQIDVTSLADLTHSSGETWAEWAESAPKACDRTNDGKVGYLTRHVPFVWYEDVYASKCDKSKTNLTGDVLPMTLAQMTSALSSGTGIPNFLLITPNEFDDGDAYDAACAPGVTNHTQAEVVCTDAWLHHLLPSLIDDTALFAQTAVLIAYDQTSTSDDSGAVVGADGGHVYASVVSPDVIAGSDSTTPYTAYSLLTTTEWLLGLPGGTLENDNWTLDPPMMSLFGA